MLFMRRAEERVVSLRINDPPAPLEELAPLVVKEGLALGGLSERQRSLALGLACCHVPADIPLREGEVNIALKAALALTCRFLAVDHVELRRWLVDTGWLVRDGFGREYRRVGGTALQPASREIASALACLEPTTWVEGLRDALRAERDLRRAAWQARASGAKG
jgi:hypothetical protein